MIVGAIEDLILDKLLAVKWPFKTKQYDHRCEIGSEGSEFGVCEINCEDLHSPYLETGRAWEIANAFVKSKLNGQWIEALLATSKQINKRGQGSNILCQLQLMLTVVWV